MPTALIIGNSQAENGATGQLLGKQLEQQGYVVTRRAKHGATASDVVNLISQLPKLDYDLAIVFSKPDSSMKSVEAIVQLLSNCKQIYWYGPPPATQITNLSLARNVFSPSITDTIHWFTSGEAAQREKDNSKLKTYFINNPRVRYVDWRTLKWDAPATQPNGVVFPNLPDGIHVTGSVAKQAISTKNWPPRSGTAMDPLLPWLIAGAGAVYLAYLWMEYRKSHQDYALASSV